VVCGSDWAHIDIGSDPAAQRILAGRTELDAAVRRRIVDTNGRRLFGIDEGFTPSGATLLGEEV
jgi:predicted TIM-barrel fold metal-dependent hydrolase